MPPKVIVTGALPRFWGQLGTGSPTAGADCGVLSTIHALEFASSNRLGPRMKTGVKNHVAKMRSRMTPQPFWPATNITNQEEALESPLTTVEMVAAGSSEVNARKFLPGTPEMLVEELTKGRWVNLAISYAWINDNAPVISGDSLFRGDHMIGMVGIAMDKRARYWTTEYDPLHDGRRAGIPKGPKVVLLDSLISAAVARGTFSFLSVRRSR